VSAGRILSLSSKSEKGRSKLVASVKAQGPEDFNTFEVLKKDTGSVFEEIPEGSELTKLRRDSSLSSL
jgi:hypothetical protein